MEWSLTVQWELYSTNESCSKKIDNKVNENSSNFLCESHIIERTRICTGNHVFFICERSKVHQTQKSKVRLAAEVDKYCVFIGTRGHEYWDSLYIPRLQVFY